MFRLLKKFFLIFGSEVDRVLDDLDTIRKRSIRIQKQYEERLAKLGEVRVTNEASLVHHEKLRKEAQALLDSLERSLIKASNTKKPDEELEVINNEIEFQEIVLNDVTSAYESFEAFSKELDEQARELRNETRQAQQTLELAVIRYESAQQLLKINSDHLPDNLRNQVKKVKEDADRMDSRYKGLKRVQAREPKSAEQIIRQASQSTLSVQERLAKLQSKA